MFLMAEINSRLKQLFDVFCKNHCKHRRKRVCKQTLKKADLIECPIGEWWDINDYLNDVKGVIRIIKQQYDKKNIVNEKGNLSDLMEK